MTTTWLAPWREEEGAARVRSSYRDRFATHPAGEYSAPGRINLIGEHVDYNGGLCLPMAIEHRTFVALTPRADDVILLASEQEAAAWQGSYSDIGPGKITTWAAYALGVAWALRDLGYPVAGFTALVDSCVPYGAGLSSSAALECAIAVALADQFQLGLASCDEGRKVLAQACIRAENEIAGAATGGLDQAASLRCQENHSLLLDCRDYSARLIPFTSPTHAILVIDTRAPHQLADGQYAARRRVTAAAARRLGYATLREATTADLAKLPAEEQPYVRHVVTEIARVQQAVACLEADDLEAVGPILTAGHASLRDDYQVTVPELDVACAAAESAGALGARMVGGGFGGSVIALVARADAEAVAQGVADAFQGHGFTAPHFLLARPSGPAR